MDNNQIRDAFNTLRSNILSTDEGIRNIISSIAGRLQLSGCGDRYDHEAQALTTLKRELRNWDIGKQKWIEPK